MARTNKTAQREEEKLLRFVERFALVISESGIPRMPARVFAYALASDAGSYTAREFADGLRVSPAAISGAVRYLTQVGLLGKEHTPGARSDHYRVDEDGDMWASMYLQQNAMLSRWADIMDEGARVLGEQRPGGCRLRESQHFFEFMRDELPRMVDRWHEYRREHRLEA